MTLAENILSSFTFLFINLGYRRKDLKGRDGINLANLLN